MTGLAQRRTQALARHLQEPKAGDTTDLHTGTIHLQRIAHAIFHVALITRIHHVNEVNDDEPAQITQAQLPGYFVGGFEVGVKCGVLNIFPGRGPGRIDVNGSQRLGVVNKDRATGRQAYFPGKSRLNLAFDLIAVKERIAVAVEFELDQILRHHLLHEFARAMVGAFIVNPDFGNVIAQIVT